MSWTFNPPPGWPAPPEGWRPPPGWAPDPSWPPAPEGWQFWVADDGEPSTAPVATEEESQTPPVTPQTAAVTSGHTAAPPTGLPVAAPAVAGAQSGGVARRERAGWGVFTVLLVVYLVLGFAAGIALANVLH